MPKVKFLKTCVPNNQKGRDGLKFESGQVYELKADAAAHWVNRGVAIAVADSVKTVRRPAPVEPEDESESESKTPAVVNPPASAGTGVQNPPPADPKKPTAAK